MKHSDDNNPPYRHRRMASLLLIWVLAACIVPNIWLSLSDGMTFVQGVANIILPAGIYLLCTSLSRHAGRTALWMITIMFFAAFQLVLLYMYGRSVIAVDMFLNVVTTNPGEVSELLGNMIIIMTVICILYLTPIITAVIAVIKKWRISRRAQSVLRKAGYYTTACGILAAILSFGSARPYNPLKDLFPLNAMYNVGLAVDRTVRLSHYDETSSAYTFNATSIHPDSVAEVYVMIIGETSRADNWQLLGYDRPTTPRLVNRNGLVAYPRAISQSNTTHKSVPMLLSALDAYSFGDSIYHSKSIITAFKEAGFHTAFISNQNRNHSFIDRFGQEADTCIFIRDDKPAALTGQCSYDTDMMPYLDNELRKSHKKKFIVLHCYGSHFNYIDRYPKANATFKPDGPSEATYHFRKQQINAYDNTILFTADLLAAIMDKLEAGSFISALAYTSDHGEDIFDDSRRLFLHASPIPSYYQIHVPFLVWVSPQYAALHPHTIGTAKANSDKFVASSSAFFHTMIDMAGISTPRFHAAQSVTSPDYTPATPMYLNDHNEATPLADCGLLEPDYVKLDSIGIALQHR